MAEPFIFPVCVITQKQEIRERTKEAIPFPLPCLNTKDTTTEDMTGKLSGRGIENLRQALQNNHKTEGYKVTCQH